MTKREAIRECKRMWKEIEKSGLSKSDFLYDSPAGRYWVLKNYDSNCSLCEYTLVPEPDYNNDVCEGCPLMTQYGTDCTEMGYKENPPPPEWFAAVKGLKE